MINEKEIGELACIILFVQLGDIVWVSVPIIIEKIIIYKIFFFWVIHIFY